MNLQEGLQASAQSTGGFSFMPPLPFTLNERHLSPIPFAHEHADRSPGRRLAASSSVHPYVTSLQRIQRQGSEGDVQPLRSWCWGARGGEQTSCLPQCPAEAAQGGARCSAEERGLPSSRPCAARLDTALRSPGTGMRNQTLRAVGDELAHPKKGFRRASLRAPLQDSCFSAS